jgi:hypothetical protein
MFLKSSRHALVAALLLARAVPALAGPDTAAPRERIDLDVIARIRDEGLTRSQLPQTLSYLTEVIGPRLTGSPSLRKANEWTRTTLAGWGLSNAKEEAWGPFGRGWSSERFAAQVIAPVNIPLIAYPKAWSTGWSGTAELVWLDAAREDALAAYKGKLKGKIVLISPVREVAAHFTPEGSRYTDDALAEMAQAASPSRRGAGGPPPPGGDLSPEQRRRFQAMATERALGPRKLQFAKEEGAVLVLDSARGDGGTVFVQQASVPSAAPPALPGAGGNGQAPRRINYYSKDAEKAMIPQASVAVEHYNRLIRLLQAGAPVKLAVDFKVAFHDKDPMCYNTTAELPGTDKAAEIVMCGGHLDSWQSGTGATDNAAGVAVCMEALRILKAIGAQPRRTIRVGLWTGEEQGIMGSAAYVKEHFGSKSAPGAEHAAFSSYFNLDNGTGKIRGIYCQGNEGVAPIFAQWLEPFHDLGATTVTLRNTGGTDHLPFDGAGLPGFQFIQDTIEYNSRTHHSNQDVFDRVQLDDLKQAATIMAAFLYNAATRDDKLPRKP